MKILNSTTRDIINPLHKTTISELSTTTELKDASLIHLVQYLDGNGPDGKPRYESMHIKVGQVKNKIFQSVQNTLKTDYWATHLDKESGLHSNTSTYKEMLSWIDSSDDVVANEVRLNENNFVEHVNYDFLVMKKYLDSRDAYLQNQIDTINYTLDGVESHFSPMMQITTTNDNGDITHTSVNHTKNDDTIGTQMTIDVGNKISNSWTVPATGNLVIYGWLDSSDALNNKAIQTSFCVIEAKINSEENGDVWEIIGVQTVIPAKSITYVGFNLLAKEGLTIRARTGFTVGAKSGQCSNEQDGFDTLSTNRANSFKCQVFGCLQSKWYFSDNGTHTMTWNSLQKCWILDEDSASKIKCTTKNQTMYDRLVSFGTINAELKRESL